MNIVQDIETRVMQKLAMADEELMALAQQEQGGGHMGRNIGMAGLGAGAGALGSAAMNLSTGRQLAGIENLMGSGLAPRQVEQAVRHGAQAGVPAAGSWPSRIPGGLEQAMYKNPKTSMLLAALLGGTAAYGGSQMME